MVDQLQLQKACQASMSLHMYTRTCLMALVLHVVSRVVAGEQSTHADSINYSRNGRRYVHCTHLPPQGGPPPPGTLPHHSPAERGRTYA